LQVEPQKNFEWGEVQPSISREVRS